jgi:hypothetical protein
VSNLLGSRFAFLGLLILEWLLLASGGVLRHRPF